MKFNQSHLASTLFFCSFYNVCVHIHVVPYAWDDTTLKEKLCLRVKAGSEPRCFDLESFGTKGKVYYESYFYIVAMGTRKELPVGVVDRDEFVLDVPQGKAVILSRKVVTCIKTSFSMHTLHVAPRLP